MNWYNEIDHFNAEWLRSLMGAGVIADWPEAHRSCRYCYNSG
jgi:hypothetical protein